jgi:hypothetical protein
MKKLIFITAFIIMAGIAYGQSLQKGNFIGFHVYTINLDPDVTMNQYLEVWKNKVIPAFDKNFQSKSYIIKGVRGECENCFGTMTIWESEAERDKFFNENGGLSEVGQAARVKYQPALDESAKLGKWSSTYTDWVIQ